MTFSDVKKATIAFEGQLRESIGRNVIDGITVNEPSGEEDELHFLRLVTWCYVLLNEAGYVTFKHLLALLRTSDPAAMKNTAKTRENVNNLRTTSSHNLPSDGKGNDHKKRQAEIWLSTNGGQPVQWPRCCRSLCSEMIELLDSVNSAWKRATNTPEDRTIAVSQFLEAVEKHWPAFAFDPFVEEAASELEIAGLDIVTYREHRFDDWRQLIALFVDSDSARSAIRRAIRNELMNRFGDGHSLRKAEK